MELRQLKYFLKAKELLNFTEAANSLNISQSTLSQQIKQLENEVHVPLFHRIGKRVTLTEAGALFAVYARESINRAEDGLLLLKDLSNLNKGKMAIGVTDGLRNHLMSALQLFSKQFTQIKIQIVFGTSKELLEKLKNFELDFVLTFHDNQYEKTFVYQDLFSSPMTLVVSAKSEFTQRKSVSIEEIGCIPLALPSLEYSTTQFICNSFIKKGIQPNIAIEINDVATILELVSTDQYSTILAQTTVSPTSKLITIPIKGKDMIRKAMIISLEGTYEKRAVGEFYKLLYNTIIT